MPNARPTLLYINLSRSWGGLEIFSVNLFKDLSAKGWKIFFAVEAGSKIEAELAASPYAANLIPLRTTKYFDPISFFKLRLMITRHNIRLVHTFKSSDIFFAALAALFLKRSRIRLIHHLQMLPKHARKDIFHRLIYRRLDMIITITRQIAERVKKLWPVSEEIVTTVYTGIKPELYAKNRFDRAAVCEEYGVPPSKRVLAIVGQVCEIKGQLLVLEAFKELLQEFPDILLVIAGAPARGGEGYYRKVQDCLEKDDLAQSVKLIGFVQDIPKLLALVEISVLGSVAEPFGLVVIEAMSAGCVVVASNAGGVPEIIDSGKDGILYTAQDRQSLVNALRAALTLDSRQRSEMLAAARQKIETKFALPAFLSNIEERYLKLSAQPPASD